VRVWLWLVLALASFGVARGARTIAESQAQEGLSEPYAPSPTAAPYISLGYREAFADALFVRLRGYFGDVDSTPDVVAELCEAIVTLDVRYHRAYSYCAGAISFFALTSRRHGNNDLYLRAIKILDQGMREFPRDWTLPELAGQIYTQDLQTDDPAQRREWDEKGLLLIESAVRKPGAPAVLADWAAVMRTKFGQQQRAVRDLKEVLLLTTDARARKALLQRLAQLENENADAIAGEIFEARKRFERDWLANRPDLPGGWYVVLGPRLHLWFDPTDLATGGRELVTAEWNDKLEPLY
jgi:hypothetical protein